MIGLLLKIIFLPVTLVFGILTGIVSLFTALFTGGISAALAVLSTGITIITNLFRLALRSVTQLILIPVNVLGQNFTFFLVIGLGVLLYFLITENAKKVPQEEMMMTEEMAPTLEVDPSLQPLPNEQAPVKGKGKQKVILIEPVQKREDGNSVFATDLYKIMTPDERAYYSHVLYWTMNNLPDGQTQKWDRHNINGDISISQSFDNKLGDRCRKFSERLKVHTIEQTLGGTACERGGGAWCKLKVNATPACNLGGKRGFWDSIKSWF